MALCTVVLYVRVHVRVMGNACKRSGGHGDCGRLDGAAAAVRRPLRRARSSPPCAFPSHMPVSHSRGLIPSPSIILFFPPTVLSLWAPNDLSTHFRTPPPPPLTLPCSPSSVLFPSLPLPSSFSLPLSFFFFPLLPFHCRPNVPLCE